MKQEIQQNFMWNMWFYASFYKPLLFPIQSVSVFSPVSLQPKCDGQVLLTQVWKHLNLIECDYFGLEFKNVQSYWVCVFYLLWKLDLTVL